MSWKLIRKREIIEITTCKEINFIEIKEIIDKKKIINEPKNKDKSLLKLFRKNEIKKT